ncbi:hypothetical protein ABT390_34050 [Streptomyces aurantiacus]|uniref:Helix-turn-helix domain-containing protein n=1 Tax=Streptomyces aurantiacus JA 4570 TaxID=1286094 RepID=S4AZS6_9ACTN|nr:hypothetical protein [Streptomyces aurantiacus]EPH46857.1 hypothetical protein STRAU_0023 [Streptomyces aurantiacus JA 4570]
MTQMTVADFSAAMVSRAWEPPEEVVVSRPLAYAEELQPEDYGVLIRLLLRDPGQPSGMKALAEEFQATGWKMGESRLRGVMGRLKKAGHVRHEQVGYDTASKRPVWAFTVFRNPANNPEHARTLSSASSQVSPTGGFPTDESASSNSHPLDSNVLAGQTLSLDSNVSNTHLLDSNALESNRCAGQADTAISNRWVGHPPHPPEEVETSSPYPLTDTSGHTAPSAREEGEEKSASDTPTDEAVDAAEQFLQELPRPWTAGRVTAKKLAPLLAVAAAEQGWDLDQELVVELTQNPEGVKRFPATLKARIDDLPRRVGRRRGVPTQRGDAPPGLPTEPDFEPVPMPAKVAGLLAGLRKPTV